MYEQLDLSSVISKIKISGRFQKIVDRPMVIVDVGHNVQAALNLKHQIRQLTIASHAKRYAICGLMSDKAISEVLKSMDDVIDIWYFVDLPLNRAATSEELQKCYYGQNLNRKTYLASSVQQAFQNMSANITPDDQIIVFGSFVTVGETLCLELLFEKND